MARTVDWLVSATVIFNTSGLHSMATEIGRLVSPTAIRLDCNAIAQIIGVPSEEAGPDCAAYLREQGGYYVLQTPSESSMLVTFQCRYQFGNIIQNYLREKLQKSVHVSMCHDV